MVEVQSTMCHSYLPKSDIPAKPDCVPGKAHHWNLETARSAADDGRVGTSDGVCKNCNATYTFYNSITDYDMRANQQIYIGNCI